jgi:glyoxylase-like metal-dependent hydrolase (beta-lactamase superfamily II)
MSWFATRKLDEDTYLLSEPPHVNSYLILGSRRAVLFDTGMGIANIREVIDGLTDHDVSVINSHYHFDHVGGNSLFPQIAIHTAGREPLGQEVPAEWLTAYGRYTKTMLAAFQRYKDADDHFFRLLTAEIEPRPLPDGFDIAAWRIQPTVPTQVLRDGDVLELGGRRLQVLHTPGHTPDCICLLDQGHKQLFAGDTLTTGPHYAHLPDSDLAAFTRSTRRLADEVTRQVEVVYPAHMLRYAAPAELITQVADGFACVSEGRAEARPGTDIFGHEVREFWFETFSITLPAFPGSAI